MDTENGGRTAFPYGGWRKGQREVAEEVSKAIREGGVLFLNAPTGFGKTAAVIYGALEAGAERVLYLVRTVNEIDPVVRELKRFGASFTFMFSARRMCPLMASPGSLPPVEDFWGNCRIARIKGVCDYHARLEEKMVDGSIRLYLDSHPGFSAYRIAWDMAKFEGVCPFFALRGLVEDSTFTIATYPYFFKRDIFESFLEPYRYEDFVVVVDEAHSLVNAHSLLEQRISQREVQGAVSELEEYVPSAKSLIEGLKKIVETMSGIRAPRIKRVEKAGFLDYLGDLEILADVVEIVRMKKAEEALNSLGPQGLGRVKTSISRILSWAEVLFREDSHLFAEEDERGVIWLVATPLDPSSVASEPLERARAAILMSGTMPPVEVMRQVLGVSREVRLVEASLAYGVGRYGRFYTILVADVTTAYRHRSDSMYRLIASRISLVSRGLPGVKLVVYPSYEVLHRVVERLPKEFELIVETRSVSLEQVESKILSHDASEPLIINSVAGGKLVEGVEFIDYEGNNVLSTVIVVGVPFPQPDDYTRSLLESMSKRMGMPTARKLVYLVNPVIKVRQALGRAIRGPEDRAVYVLMDHRYLRRDIRRALSMGFDRIVRGAGELEEALVEARRVLDAV